MQELCHAMMPMPRPPCRSERPATTSSSKCFGGTVASPASCSSTNRHVIPDVPETVLEVPPKAEVEAVPDAAVEASTSENRGTAASGCAPEADAASQAWTSISTKRRKGKAALPWEGQQQQHPRQQQQQVQQPVAGSPARATQASHHSSCRDNNSHAPHVEGGKSRGLSHFQRIKVGIEDDPDFRVVQRLIGPRGKNVQDIVSRCNGVKIWIIGKGSRSWEDDAGPLTVCVGATSATVYDFATGLIQELLGKVRDEHAKFSRGRGGVSRTTA